MPLDRQLVSFPLLEGVDTKTDPNQLATGQLAILENGVFDSPKRIEKRNGIDQYTNAKVGGGTLSTLNAVTQFNDELLTCADDGLYSYSKPDNGWVYKGALESTSIANLNQPGVDYATHISGVTIGVFVYRDPFSSNRFVKYSISDNTTGQILGTYNGSSALFGSTIIPRVVTIGSHFYCVVFDSNNSGNLYSFSVPVSGYGTPGSYTAIITDLAASAKWDLTSLSNNGYVAYDSTHSTNSVGVAQIQISLAVATFYVATGEAITNAITIIPDFTLARMYVSYSGASNVVKAFSFDTATNTPTAIASGVSDTPVAMVGSMNNGAGVVYLENASGTSTIDTIVTASLTYTPGSPGSMAVGGAVVVLSGSLAILSKPFFRTFQGATTAYLPVSYTDGTFAQGTYFVLNTSSLQAVAKIAPGLTNNVKANAPAFNTFTFTPIGGSQQWKFPAPLNAAPATPSRVFIANSNDRLCTVSFNPQEDFINIKAANTVQFSGGASFSYDGQYLCEQNFHTFPYMVSLTTQSNGFATQNGTYTYASTFTWTDNNSQTQYSTVSPAQTVTVTTGHQVTITYYINAITSKNFANSPLRITTYRTVAGGSVLYTLGISQEIIISVPSASGASTVTVVDIQDDSALLNEKQCYSQQLVNGGEVNNFALPATKFITTYKNRAMAIPYEDATSFWYSKDIISDNAAPFPVEFSLLFLQDITTRGGELVAAAQLDDKFILFKDNEVFYIVGDGPAPNGTNNDFSDAQIITTDTGCNNPKSIAITPIGIMFSGPKGIYLLDRSLAVSYIGAPVEAYNLVQITGAELLQKSRRVIFSTANGYGLVYDYYIGKWSIFTNVYANGSCIYEQNYFMAGSGPNASYVCWISPFIFADTVNDSTQQYTSLKIGTGPITFAGVQGFQRIFKIFLLGTYMTPHKLQVTIQYDYNPQAEQVVTFDVGSLFNQSAYGSDPYYGQSTPYGGTIPQYQFEIDTDIQKCESIQITIEDLYSTAYDEGFSLSSIGFEVGVEGKGMRLPAPQRIGS